MQNNSFIYKTETHLHTKETSRCGKVSAEDHIRGYKELGYTTVFVTDHYRWDLFDSVSAEEAAEVQLLGYRTAKKIGEEVGINVILGCEIDLCGNDYLLYGIDESFFTTAPINDVREDPIAFKKMCEEMGITVIAAHPFRYDRTPVVEAIDGIEKVNASHGHYYKNHNEKAAELAEKMPHLLTTSGSDAHKIKDMGCGGIMTEEVISSSDDYIRILRSGWYSLIDISPENK
ncbi:MAG: PHP domain-containing protein [Clostridia bacterium]|nr:PHP domain-containing protein [Clostridia bacterium]